MSRTSSKSAFQQIAQEHHFSDVEAAAFCVTVQQVCGAPVPNYARIALYVQQHPDWNAQRLGDGLRAELEPERKRNKASEAIRQEVLARSRKRRERDGYTGGDTISTTPPIRHDTRDAVAGWPHCPHGVLFTQVCAICEPERWRLENGSD